MTYFIIRFEHAQMSMKHGKKDFGQFFSVFTRALSTKRLSKSHLVQRME